MSNSKLNLIAMVATAAIVNGERVVFQPGDELPDLSKHDEKELLASGAAQSPALVEKQARADAAIESKGVGEFLAARKNVQAEAASIAPAAAPAATPAAPAAPAAKTAGKAGK